MITFMNWVAYLRGQCGCSSPDTKVLHGLPVVRTVDDVIELRRRNVTPLTEKTRPKLDPDDAENEEDEKAQEEHVSQHGEGVQQEHDENPHAWKV